MQKLLDRFPRHCSHTLGMLAIVLMNLCFLCTDRFEGMWKIMTVVPAFGVTVYLFVNREVTLDRFTVLLSASCGFLFLSAFINRKLGVNASIKLICYITFMLYPAIMPKSTEHRSLQREATSLATLVVCFLLPLMALGVASVFLGKSIPIPGFDKPIGLPVDGQLNGRMRVLAHTNNTGMYAVAAILLSVYLMHRRIPKAVRALLGAAILIFALALAHTQSRTALYALCAGAGAIAFHFFCLHFRGRRWRVPAGFIVWIATLALIFVLLLGVFSLDIHIAQRLQSDSAQEAAENDPSLLEQGMTGSFDGQPDASVSRVLTAGATNLSGSGRVFMWKTALRYLIDHPVNLLFGMGPSDVMEPMEKAYDVEFGSHAHLHSSYVELLTRGGIICFLCMMAALVLLIRPAARLLVTEDAEGDRGAYILPVFMIAFLIISLAEPPLFTAFTFENLLFFLCAGHVARLDREKKLG